MELALDDKGCMITPHSPTWDFAEPERKMQRLGEDSDESGCDSNSYGCNSDGSGGDGSSGYSNVFVGNEHYQHWTREEKRQHGRYNHQTIISSCYYLDFVPTVYGPCGPRAIDFSDQDYRQHFFPRLMRCIEVALRKQKEELGLFGIVRANYSVGYGFVYWITMDVRNKEPGEIKTCICKVHFGVKGGTEDDMIVEHFKFIPSNFKFMQGTTLNEQAASLLDTA